MRYLVDVTQKQSDEINRLINAGKYQTVAQFISTAVENQIYIESSDQPVDSTTKEKKGVGILNNHEITEFRAIKKIMLSEIKNRPQIVSMPKFTDLAVSLYEAGEEKCWLWGQTNKILPVKIGLRVLYSVMGTDQWLELEEYRKKAVDIAVGLGTIIRKNEDEKSKMRDDRISAGLPEENFTSKSRYKSQFLAYMRRDKKLEGAMPFLRFVNLKINDKGKIFIGLTEPGLTFAKLINPVIDNNDFENSFSEKEIDFYLDHITNKVKGESEAIKWLLRKLTSGIADREQINLEVKKEFGSFWNDASDAVINTQRAGLMARMFELELIDKDKKGVSVVYKITDLGSKFLKK